MKSPSYPVDLHTHTVASTHAYSTILEYVAQARQVGIRLFATTDHGPALCDAPHPWHFINLRAIPRILDGIGILRGIEANIVNDQGDTDCTDQMAASLDIVLAGLHAPCYVPKGKTECTRAMVNAIRSGKVHIITHPGNPQFPIDAEEVAAAAAECQVALEVNNSSFVHTRKGSWEPCVALISAVKERGGWISLGSDSHFSLQLGGVEKSIALAQYVGFPEERILNASPRRILNFLEMRTGKKIEEFQHF